MPTKHIKRVNWISLKLSNQLSRLWIGQKDDKYPVLEQGGDVRHLIIAEQPYWLKKDTKRMLVRRLREVGYQCLIFADQLEQKD